MQLRAIDLGIIIAYLAGVTLLGIAFRRNQHSLRDYLLGGRTAPWWALAFSIVATETSTLTIIGTPALAYAGNLGFLQVVMGYLVGRVAIVLLFLPHYFRGEFFTAYQFIERRFGQEAKRAAAATFLLTRVLAEGVRVAAVGLVVSAALGTGPRASAAVVVALTLLYTFEGGMKAVIWTDVVQACLYLAGSLLAFALLLHGIPGGWSEVVRVSAVAGNKLRVFDFSFSWRALGNPAKTYTFWSGVIGGGFLTMASHGTDQTIVQRLLSAKSERESKWALLASGVIIFAQFALFLLIGVMLFVRDGAPAIVAGQSYDSVFPQFIITALPVGLRGLVIASILAVAMSNLSGSLNSLAASSVLDFRAIWAGARGFGGDVAGADQARLLRRSRWMTVAWGAAVLALGTAHWGPVLEAGLTIASITYGSLLGLFLLGTLDRRANQAGAILGMFAGLAALVLIHKMKWLDWTWYVLAGALVTFAVGALASLIFGARTPTREQREA
ncbi:MAG: sodium:solute symporter [Candidatus Acidiferrales bacterium]